MAAPEPSSDAAPAPRLRRYLPAPDTRKYHLLLGRGGAVHPGPTRWGHRRLHGLQSRLHGGRSGAGRHPRLDRHLRLRRRGEARRQLHADHGRFGGLDVRHGRSHSGHGVARHAAAGALEADALFQLHRHVRNWGGDALHAHPRRPAAARIPLGACGRQHPARAHGRAAAPPFHRQARRGNGRRHRSGRCSCRTCRCSKVSGCRRRRSAPGSSWAPESPFRPW